MGEFKDHRIKKVIREQWCKPLIRFLHDLSGHKLLYLGLPAPEAIDLLTWLDYIDRVIAFQCRVYKEPSSVSQPKLAVQNLITKLSGLEKQEKIKNFFVYDGYIEEVVSKGKDTTGAVFGQNEVVTVYNLDFCNGITSPLRGIDEKGNPCNFYKSEVIRKLIEMQRDISVGSPCNKRFIMYLTIHSEFLNEEKEHLVTQVCDDEIKKYIKTLGALSKSEKSTRVLRAYMYQMIKNFFCHCGFTPDFLPVIRYLHEPNWLIHFTITGIKNSTGLGISPCFQSSSDFLNQKFITIKDDKFIFMTNAKIKEVDCLPDVVKAFKSSESYNQLWIKAK